VIGGGLTRIGETPVGRFRLAVSGVAADRAIGWIAERGGYVHRTTQGAPDVAA
jgi:D-methionine transport system ATP-binding protein